MTSSQRLERFYALPAENREEYLSVVRFELEEAEEIGDLLVEKQREIVDALHIRLSEYPGTL